VKLFISFYLLVLSTICGGSTPDIDQIRDNIINQFSQIEDYQVDIKISVKMTGFRMPKKKIKLYYKSPDKLKVKTKGFAILPKTGADGNPNEFLDMFTDITEIKLISHDNKSLYEITGNVNRDSLKIPISTEKDEIPNISMKVFVDADHWVMTKAAVYLESENIFTIETSYIEVSQIMVPEKTVFKIGIKGISRWSTQNPFDYGGPGSDRQDFENIAKNAGYDKDKDEFVGEMVMKFSKYKINKGLDDSLFEE